MPASARGSGRVGELTDRRADRRRRATLAAQAGPPSAAQRRRDHVDVSVDHAGAAWRLLDRAAEVEVGHLGVVEHLVRRPVEQDAAALHHDPVGRDAAARSARSARRAGSSCRPALIRATLSSTCAQRLRVEAERRLVEQHELRVEHQRAGELDHPPLAAGQVAGLARRRARRRPGRAPRPRRSGAARSARSRRIDVGAHQHVLAHRDVSGTARRTAAPATTPAAQDLRRGEPVRCASPSSVDRRPRAGAAGR